jgi:hypothetical protein
MFRASPGTDFFFFLLASVCLLAFCSRGREQIRGVSPRRASFIVAFFSLGICSKRYPISGIPSLVQGNYIVACFSTGISSRKNHTSRIPSFLQAREFHRCLLPDRHFLQEESQLRNSELCASTGAPSPLVFRPAFPPGRITSPQFQAVCKHGSSISACFSAGISSRKHHISRIQNLLQARQLCSGF